MKIVAHIGSNSVLVEMSRREVANVTGKYSDGEMASGGTYTRDDGFSIGREYLVGEIFNRLRSQESASRELVSCSKNLRALADLVDQQQWGTILVGKPDEAEVAK